MNRFNKLIFLIMLLFCPLLWAEDKQALDATSKTETENQTDTTNQIDTANQADTTNKVERFVLPITQWIEETVRNSPLIRLPEKPHPATNPSKGLDLRSAIRQATQRYPGTVLNAEKRTSNEVESYHIRIISQQGVIKTITIGQDESTSEPDEGGTN